MIVIQKNRSRTTVAEPIGETLAELPFTGDQVVCLSHVSRRKKNPSTISRSRSLASSAERREELGLGGGVSIRPQEGVVTAKSCDRPAGTRAFSSANNGLRLRFAKQLDLGSQAFPGINTPSVTIP